MIIIIKIKLTLRNLDLDITEFLNVSYIYLKSKPLYNSILV